MAIRKAALARLSQVTPQAIEETIKLALEDADSRVRTINLAAIREYVLGKPTETPAGQEEGRLADISHLSAIDRQRLSEALSVVFELTGRGPGALIEASADD